MRLWMILLIFVVSTSVYAQDNTLPDFDHPPVDVGLLHDRDYRQLTGMVHVVDAPDGNLMRTIDQGFGYVTMLEQRGEWAKINPDEWVRSVYLAKPRHEISRFSGIFLPRERPQYPIAWVIENAYPSSEPGGLPIDTQNPIRRYTLVQLFESTTAGGMPLHENEMRFRINDDQWLPETVLAQVLFLERPPAVDTRRWMSIDLHQQVLVVYDEGDVPIFATLVSAGLPEWPTYQGVFHITQRLTRRTMSWGTPGEDFYYLEDVPWTMFFDNGRALHGTYWHDDLGVLNSRGCLNLSITDAYWLYHWVAEEFETLESVGIEYGPAVVVYSSE